MTTAPRFGPAPVFRVGRPHSGLIVPGSATPGLSLSQVASDNFNRANGNIGGANGWATPSDPTMTIASNEASGVAGNIAGNYRTEAYSGDQYSQCTVGTVKNVTADFIGLVLRHNAATNAEYAALYFDNAGSPECDIYFRLGPGAYTQLASQAVAALSTGDVLTFVAVGGQLAFQVNGVTIISVPDAQITGGAPGITSFGAVTLDNWVGGNAVMSPLSAAISSDNFNRANGNMSAGQANWSPILTTFSGAASVDPIIVSNELNVSVAQHYTANRLEAFSANQWAQIAMGSVALTEGSAGFVGCITRWDGTKCIMGCIFGNPLSYRLYLVQSNTTSTQLGASVRTKVNPTGTTFTVVSQGSRHSLRVNGLEVLVATDATRVSGQPGVQMFAPSTADNHSAGNA